MNVLAYIIFYLYITKEPQVFISLTIYNCWWKAQTESVQPSSSTTNDVHWADN